MCVIFSRVETNCVLCMLKEKATKFNKTKATEKEKQFLDTLQDDMIDIQMMSPEAIQVRSWSTCMHEDVTDKALIWVLHSAR